MNINHHNYEEYFILYLDNELSSAERHMVETFVQNNPDLKDELDILLQSKLDPDNNIVFENKEELMKPSNGSTITLSNYEEWLTLYVDNELNHEEKGQIETFIVSHPQVKVDLAILQKAKLQPEEIIFPYKESLYRRTGKVRVVQIRWWRVAAAAILLLAIGITVVLVLNKKKQPEQSVASTRKKDNQNTTAPNSVTKKVDDKVQNQLPAVSHDDKPSIAQTSEQKRNNKNKVEKNELTNNIPAKEKEQAIANNDNNKPSNDLPQPLDNPYFKNDATKSGIAETKIQNIETNVPQTNNTLVTKQLPKTSNEGLTFASNPDKSSSDLQESGQNKSSRGIFRKAVRFLEKRTGIKTANDDDKVLIGALAVKLN